MEILKTITEKAKNLTFKDILLFITAFALVFFMFKSCYYKNKYVNRPIIPTDSVSYYKNKLGEEYTAKELIIAEKKELEDINSELYAEVKSLRDNPIVVTKTQIKILTDTILTQSDSISTTHTDSATIKNLHWSNNSQYFSINGLTSVKSDFSEFTTQINSLSMPATLTMDVIEKDKKLYFITKSDNPYINVQNMEGVMMNPQQSKIIKSYFKPKRFGIGVQAGYGVDYKLRTTPYIGIGISYNIIQF